MTYPMMKNVISLSKIRGVSRGIMTRTETHTKIIDKEIRMKIEIIKGLTKMKGGMMKDKNTNIKALNQT